MPPEREAVDVAFTWTDKTLLSFVAMFVVGAMARVFISDEPFDFRRFAGEVMLAALAAIMMYSFGLLQGLTLAQMMFLGSLGGLGGVKVVEWLLQIIKTAKDAG